METSPTRRSNDLTELHTFANGSVSITRNASVTISRQEPVKSENITDIPELLLGQVMANPLDIEHIRQQGETYNEDPEESVSSE